MLDWIACALVKTASAVLCRLPPQVAVQLGAALGQLAAWLQPKRTYLGIQNLRAAFDGQLSPGETQRLILACYRQLGSGILELLRLPVMDQAYLGRYIAIDGLEHFDRAAASGRPVILLTGHYGNWELSSITAALKGYPIMALARAQKKFPRLYRLLVSLRESKGCRIIHKGGAMKRLIAALDGRQLVGIVGDQASRQGIFVEFFGRPALFATGPFELAHSKSALILPAFIHRVRGPYHRVVVEPPLALSRAEPKPAAVRAGVEQFAAGLSRHIREAPDQWLWMHKRWKHTTARRVLVLSDGKPGHVKQSLAVVDILRERHPALTQTAVEIRYRSRLARLACLIWSWASGGRIGAERCLAWTLTPESAQALLGRYADLIVSCGASLAPVNLLWAGEHRAKSVVVMNPSPLPTARFSLVIAPRHDGLPRRANVVPIAGAFAAGPSEAPAEAAAHLRAHPRFRSAPQGPVAHRHPVVAVLLGGDTAQYTVDAAFADGLALQVQAACERADGWFLVTTSRRTAAEAEQALAARVDGDARCRLLLLASRDPLDGTMEGILASADAVVATGESISMVSEACAAGRRVVAVMPPLRPHLRGGPAAKHQRFLSELAREGYLTLAPLDTLARAIDEALAGRTPAKRLDNLAVVREAMEKLL